MLINRIVSHEEWLTERRELLAAEKRFTLERDALTRRRMAMPWERVEKAYKFQGEKGTLSLGDLFEGRSQLVVYHFMFAPDWQEGCKACSFWADNFDGATIHLKHRDVTFTAISRASVSQIKAYKNRLGWNFPWVSSFESDFNYDFQTSFTPEQVAEGTLYHNYEQMSVGSISSTDEKGISVFFKSDEGEVFHTYSCYMRGIDMFNVTYQFLDIVPKGRDEDRLASPIEWLRRHDQY